MDLLSITALLLTMSAVFSYINYRFLKIPTTIGLIIITLIFSIGFMLLEKLGFHSGLEEIVKSIDFNETLLVGMLSFLLFAGALHVNLEDLSKRWVEIGIFATIGVIASTFIIGSCFYLIFDFFDIKAGFIHCLLFGALISPTDPIAVLGILKQAGVSKDIETTISGESLFNDGIGVVVFIVLLGLLQSPENLSAANVVILFSKEVFGGLILGLMAGLISFYMLKGINDYKVEILITLALTTGVYAIALKLHTSGPIAIVIAGLLTGNHGRLLAMSETTRMHLDNFWELIDEILNAVLFVLIGLEVLVLVVSFKSIMLGLIAIPVVLLTRFFCIGSPMMILKKFNDFSPNIIRILTWGGLRGGISVALALSLPQSEVRDLILTMTYLVVIFSLIVQGLTIGRLVKEE